MSTLSLPPPDSLTLPRHLGVALAGAAAFGVAAGLGHGPAAMLRGAWMAPSLFAGSALLATPPLYLVGAWAGSRATAEDVCVDVASVLSDAGVVLLGLAAPTAFFSVTLRTPTAWVLLAAAVATVGATAVRALARRTLSEERARSGAAAFVWTALALALGLRMAFALAHHLPPAR